MQPIYGLSYPAYIASCIIYCSGIFSLNEEKGILVETLQAKWSALWQVIYEWLLCPLTVPVIVTSEKLHLGLVFPLAFTSLTITLCLRHRVFILFWGGQNKSSWQHCTQQRTLCFLWVNAEFVKTQRATLLSWTAATATIPRTSIKCLKVNFFILSRSSQYVSLNAFLKISPCLKDCFMSLITLENCNHQNLNFVYVMSYRMSQT